MIDERIDFEYRTHKTFQHLESNPAQVRSPYPDKRAPSLVSLCHSLLYRPCRRRKIKNLEC